MRLHFVEFNLSNSITQIAIGINHLVLEKANHLGNKDPKDLRHSTNDNPLRAEPAANLN